MKKDKLLFLERCKDYFKSNGLELSKQNGQNLSLDKKSHTKTWSIDVYVLSNYGICSAYFRNEDNEFTVSGLSIIDLYLKDVHLLSDKFIMQKDIENIKLLKNGLKF